jgi:site-specific DNA recombinase
MSAAPTTPLRCGLYARVSTDEQVEKYGLAAQLTELRNVAKARGYTIVREFVEPEGASGRLLWERPELMALRELVNDRGLDVVLTIDPDRLSRGGTLDYLLITKELRKHGTRLEYLNFTPDNTDEGRLQEQILASIAEFERAKIVARTSRGTREKARRGLMPTGAPPFGYRRDETAVGGLAVEPEEAALVRRIFTWAADGASIRSIAARLDAQGIRPRRGARWSRTSVRTILYADVYLGQGVYNRRDETGPAGVTIRDEAEWIRFAVTPIVSQALAEQARAHLQRNKSLLRGQPARRRVYLLGGLLVCGRCDRRLHGDSRNPTATYRCEGRSVAEDRCRFTVPAEAVDERVWAALLAIIQDPEALQSTAKASKLGIDARRVDAATDQADLARALAKVTQSRDRLLDLFVAGRIDQADLDAREPALKQEQARLTAAVAEAQARLVAGHADADRHAAVVKYCRLIAKGIERLDDGQRQALLRKVLTRVVVHEDRIAVAGVLQLALPQPPAGKTQETPTGEMIQSGRRLDQYPLQLTVPLEAPPC